MTTDLARHSTATQIAKADDRQRRVNVSNQFLAAIAGCGRRFFLYDDRVSRFELDERGRVWFIDGYLGARIYTHHWRWRGFSHGGTLLSLCKALREYIMGRRSIPLDHIGPWPSWYSDGDPWGYGDDMSLVRELCGAIARKEEE